MTQTNIYTDTLLDSGKNFLIHIIKEVITAITVNFSKFAYFSIYLNLKNDFHLPFSVTFEDHPHLIL